MVLRHVRIFLDPGIERRAGSHLYRRCAKWKTQDRGKVVHIRPFQEIVVLMVQ